MPCNSSLSWSQSGHEIRELIKVCFESEVQETTIVAGKTA